LRLSASMMRSHPSLSSSIISPFRSSRFPRIYSSSSKINGASFIPPALQSRNREREREREGGGSSRTSPLNLTPRRWGNLGKTLSELRCRNQRRELLEMMIARRSFAARAIPRARVVAVVGEIFDEPVASVTGRNFFPPDIPGDINCARGEAAARNFRALTRFQMFSSSREESSKVCRDAFRGSHSIKYARFLPRGDKKISGSRRRVQDSYIGILRLN